MKFPTPLPYPEQLDKLEISFAFSIKGKGRPRFDSRSGHCYMPASYRLNKEAVSWILRNALSTRSGFLAPRMLYILELVFYRKRRKPRSKADRLLLEQECPIGGICEGKPDVDNALGTVMDAANSVLYVDDSQVAVALIERRWADENGAFFRVRKHAPYTKGGR